LYKNGVFIKLPEMKTIKYVVYKEDKYYVSQCLNVDVASFGNTIQEAIDNLNEALALYFDEPDSQMDFPVINETLLGETYINV
jgi:predicted RNase H-like HicB family nuclease